MVMVYSPGLTMNNGVLPGLTVMVYSPGFTVTMVCFLASR